MKKYKLWNRRQDSYKVTSKRERVMGNNSSDKTIDCFPPDDPNNQSDGLSIQNIRKVLSEPTELQFELINQISGITNEMLPTGLLNREYEEMQRFLSALDLKSIGSNNELFKGIQLISDGYLQLFSNRMNSLENFKTSASAVDILLNSEQGTISEDEIELKVENLEKAMVDDVNANRDVAIANRIGVQGLQHFKNNPALSKSFDGRYWNTTVVSIDIRSSTQLMLNAKTPNDFVAFISDLSFALSSHVKDHFGIYDKFTGDGLLCFFPCFFSGEDHVYQALKLADSCHHSFKEVYARHNDKFSVVRSDVGLGIGIDTGETYVTFVNNEPTVIGTSVVYACRLSSAPSNTTYVNQQIYEVIKNTYKDNFEITPCEIEFKGQGKMQVYKCVFSKELDPMPLPDWATADMKDDKEAKE